MPPIMVDEVIKVGLSDDRNFDCCPTLHALTFYVVLSRHAPEKIVWNTGLKLFVLGAPETDKYISGPHGKTRLENV
jgi:hypothetical protein